MIDVQVFGEIGLIPARRGRAAGRASSRSGRLPCRAAPKAASSSARSGATTNGTVAMRGPMVPRCPFPPGVERTTLPHFKVAPNGFVDTGYACWSDRDNAPLVVTGPPPGMISVGGYRFVMRDLQDTIAEVDPAARWLRCPTRLRASAGRLGRDPAGVQRPLAGARRQSAAGRCLPSRAPRSPTHRGS